MSLGLQKPLRDHTIAELKQLVVGLAFDRANVDILMAQTLQELNTQLQREALDKRAAQQAIEAQQALAAAAVAQATPAGLGDNFVTAAPVVAPAVTPSEPAP